MVRPGEVVVFPGVANVSPGAGPAIFFRDRVGRALYKPRRHAYYQQDAARLEACAFSA